ncbi:hypothetical protein B0T25DRAFT_489824 [Lasiosphaeria hispida]|uniref:Aflatoxin biosynthesis ketoreductase nor-1 n=1 Tax=Lasiosphaeria hispida TaxID=260671 RepID=A0AAJ0H5Y3_9PEZI|nr:hypothetical protein B0T25DRAFT_489824 [Lasiosphaeria hispida]
MSPTTVFISGANRGIGRGIAEIYLSRPNHIIIAGARDPNHPSAQSLKTLPVAEGTKLIVVKLESASDTDAAAAVETIKAAGVDHLDIVIANAGISGGHGKVHEIDLAWFREAFEVNTLGKLKLYQAAYPLLQETGAGAKFVAISTLAATTTDVEKLVFFPIGAYAATKAAVNHLTRKAHYDNEWLTSFAIHPGFVQSDMGNEGARAFGLAEATDPLDTSCAAIVKVIDEASRDSIAGTHGFLNNDGTTIPW